MLTRLTAILTLIALPPTVLSEPGLEAVVDNNGYFHVEIEVAPDELLRDPDLLRRSLAYELSDGGMFEIYLPAEKLGQIAEACQRLVVRMPWTDPEKPDAPAAIARKTALFDRLTSMGAGEQTSVVLELNPYVEPTPDGLRLSQCNVFFRQYNGAYVPHTEALGP